MTVRGEIFHFQKEKKNIFSQSISSGIDLVVAKYVQISDQQTAVSVINIIDTGSIQTFGRPFQKDKRF